LSDFYEPNNVHTLLTQSLQKVVTGLEDGIKRRMKVKERKN
jgi:hypothetical protein